MADFLSGAAYGWLYVELAWRLKRHPLAPWVRKRDQPK